METTAIAQHRAKVILLVVGAVIVAAIVLASLLGVGKDKGGISKGQYQQWRSECEVRATATLDTSLYQVGGNHWVDAVNSCLTAKAND